MFTLLLPSIKTHFVVKRDVVVLRFSVLMGDVWLDSVLTIGKMEEEEIPEARRGGGGRPKVAKGRGRGGCIF